MDVMKLFVEFISIIIWPSVFASIFFFFRNEIKNLINVFSEFRTFSFKVAGQELKVEKEIKAEVAKEILDAEVEVALDENTKDVTQEQSKAKISKTKSAKMENLIPFLNTKIDKKHLIIIYELNDRQEGISGNALRQISKRAGVYSEFNDKIDSLLHAGLVIKNKDKKFVLSDIGKRVAKIAPKYMTEYDLF